MKGIGLFIFFIFVGGMFETAFKPIADHLDKAHRTDVFNGIGITIIIVLFFVIMSKKKKV